MSPLVRLSRCNDRVLPNSIPVFPLLCSARTVRHRRFVGNRIPSNDSFVFLRWALTECLRSLRIPYRSDGYERIRLSCCRNSDIPSRHPTRIYGYRDWAVSFRGGRRGRGMCVRDLPYPRTGLHSRCIVTAFL